VSEACAGRSALLVGGSGGIGRAVLDALAGAGLRTACVDVRAPSVGAHELFEADVTAPEAVGGAFGAAAARLGGLDHGEALVRQLARTARALGVGSVRTEVEWAAHDLVAFLARQGLHPAPRLCLELRLDEEA